MTNLREVAHNVFPHHVKAVLRCCTDARCTHVGRGRQTIPPTRSRARPSQHLQVVQLAGLRAGHEPRPVRRDATQRARRVERATAFLELQRRALALGNRVGSRRIERAAAALALLEELQAV